MSAHGGVYLPLWIEFLAYACENITFPQLCLRTVIEDVNRTLTPRLIQSSMVSFMLKEKAFYFVKLQIAFVISAQVALLQEVALMFV